MQNCKLQIGCMLIILYVMFIYIREKYMYRYKQKDKMFEALVITGIIMIFFDGTTACTVNYLSVVPDILNRILHLCFLSNIDIFVFIMFLYMLDITKGLPKNKKVRLGIMTPLIVNILIIIIFIPQLSYRKGSITNYSMGISAYTCYAMVMVYIFATIGIFVYRWKNIERHTRIIISTCLITSVAVTIFQMFNPEALITCLVPTLVIIGVYLNKENPLFIKLKKYNKEMVTGFATLVENRDDNTGGHIKRTTEYVRLLAQELKDRGLYKEELTKDYINNLVMAAPMHDVGKIAIPDAILQKPGKLTDEEYEIMKTHAKRGGKIIKETFGHIADDEYEEMAYEVAMHHHEKWNGKGYPDGLSEKDIPLCARIMAIADVFDAVSAKRCYRDALPREECFKIIENGKGTDFDPVITDVFLDKKEKIVEVYNDISGEN